MFSVVVCEPRTQEDHSVKADKERQKREDQRYGSEEKIIYNHRSLMYTCTVFPRINAKRLFLNSKASLGVYSRQAIIR